MDLSNKHKVERIIQLGKKAGTPEAAVQWYLLAISIMLLEQIYPQGVANILSK